MYRHILIPTDGSELSKQAVQHGIDLAKPLAAQITAVTAVPYRFCRTYGCYQYAGELHETHGGNGR
jgi:nucleotide-binding universal stress UspA family protein